MNENKNDSINEDNKVENLDYYLSKLTFKSNRHLDRHFEAKNNYIKYSKIINLFNLLGSIYISRLFKISIYKIIPINIILIYCNYLYYQKNILYYNRQITNYILTKKFNDVTIFDLQDVVYGVAVIKHEEKLNNKQIIISNNK